MPIKIPDLLPAKATLENENIFVITYDRAYHQDIRPLKLLILNLMPTKIVTETQLLRRLSNTPLQIEVELLRTESYASKNTPDDHLESFYTAFPAVKNKKYDGMIITGAPVELLNFEDVDYWDELTDIIDWTKKNVFSTLHICWGAQAALYCHYGIRKRDLRRKISGVFEHYLLEDNIPLFRGFDDRFFVPHSRYTEVVESDLSAISDLHVVSKSDDAGVFAILSRDGRQIYITGHPEYDSDTLALEYKRDLEKKLDINIPENYFPKSNPALRPLVNWRSHAQLLYTNWLNYYVYQTTPYDLSKL